VLKPKPRRSATHASRGESVTNAYEDVMRANGDMALVLKGLRSWIGQNAMIAYLAMVAARLNELPRAHPALTPQARSSKDPREFPESTQPRYALRQGERRFKKMAVIDSGIARGSKPDRST
jgi:hypothetical protein